MSSIIVPSWFNPSGYHEPENQLASPKWQAPPNQILYVMRPRQNVACERCHVDHMPTCLSISLVQSFYPIYSVENCNMHSNVSRIMYWKILEDNHWNEMKWNEMKKVNTSPSPMGFGFMIGSGANWWPLGATPTLFNSKFCTNSPNWNIILENLKRVGGSPGSPIDTPNGWFLAAKKKGGDSHSMLLHSCMKNVWIFPHTFA